MEARKVTNEKWLAQLRERMQAGYSGAPVVNRAPELVAVARLMMAAIGDLPPEPSTLRGRGGRILVALVRRALFWYTPQITRAMAALTDVLVEQGHANEAILRNHARSEARIAALELELTGLRAHCRNAHCDSDG
jgi:hypothetical protein